MNGPHPTPDGRQGPRWRASLAALAVLAVGLRLGSMFWLNTPGVYGGDEGGYVALAKQWLRTGRYTIPESYWTPLQGGMPGDATAFRTPGLPLFLALHYRLFGEDDLFPKVTLVLLSGLTCPIIACLGGELLTRRSGILAGIIWAFWPTALVSGYCADSIMAENLALFFFVAGLLCLSARGRLGYPVHLATAGLFLGAAIQARPYLVLPVLLILPWIALRPGHRGGRLGAVALVMAGLSIPLVPWLARNWVVLGRPLLSTQSEHLYLGNNAWALGSMNGDIWTKGTNAPQLKILEKSHPGIWTTGEMERAGIWKEEGLRCVRDNLRRPSHFLWLEARKALIFWLPVQDWSFGCYRYHYAYLFVASFVPAGLVIGRRRGLATGLSLLLIPVVGLFIICIVLYSHDRIRYIGEPSLVLIGSYGISEVAAAVRRIHGARSTSDN